MPRCNGIPKKIIFVLLSSFYFLQKGKEDNNIKETWRGEGVNKDGIY